MDQPLTIHLDADLPSWVASKTIVPPTLAALGSEGLYSSTNYIEFLTKFSQALSAYLANAGATEVSWQKLAQLLTYYFMTGMDAVEAVIPVTRYIATSAAAPDIVGAAPAYAPFWNASSYVPGSDVLEYETLAALRVASEATARTLWTGIADGWPWAFDRKLFTMNVDPAAWQDGGTTWNPPCMVRLFRSAISKWLESISSQLEGISVSTAPNGDLQITSASSASDSLGSSKANLMGLVVAMPYNKSTGSWVNGVWVPSSNEHPGMIVNAWLANKSTNSQITFTNSSGQTTTVESSNFPVADGKVQLSFGAMSEVDMVGDVGGERVFSQQILQDVTSSTADTDSLPTGTVNALLGNRDYLPAVTAKYETVPSPRAAQLYGVVVASMSKKGPKAKRMVGGAPWTTDAILDTASDVARRYKYDKFANVPKSAVVTTSSAYTYWEQGVLAAVKPYLQDFKASLSSAVIGDSGAAVVLFSELARHVSEVSKQKVDLSALVSKESYEAILWTLATEGKAVDSVYYPELAAQVSYSNPVIAAFPVAEASARVATYVKPIGPDGISRVNLNSASCEAFARNCLDQAAAAHKENALVNDEVKWLSGSSWWLWLLLGLLVLLIVAVLIYLAVNRKNEQAKKLPDKGTSAPVTDQDLLLM